MSLGRLTSGFRALIRCVVAVLALGCVSVPRGSQRPLPAAARASGEVRRVGTDQADGLRVLWNGAASGEALESRGSVASSPAELAALWDDVGALAPLPRVDFRHYVVFGFSHQGSYCQAEISSATFEQSGVVRLNVEDDPISCIHVAVRASLVVALPRPLLRARVLLVAPGFDHAYEFSLSPVPSSPVAFASSLPSTLGSSPLESVPLPARGHLVLATLHGGNQVWIAHESSGSLSIVSAVTSMDRWSMAGFPEYFAAAVQWRPELGRFQGGWDWRGRSVHGFAALTPHRWQIDGEGRLWVGDAIAPSPGPIGRREDAPQLDGPARAYTSPPRSSWSDLREGHLALIELDLVSSPKLGVRLCLAPKQGQSFSHFRGCSLDAPVVMGAPEHPSPPSFVIYGPFILRRRGNSAQVILSAATLPTVFAIK